ncbi:hypothetical protein SAMN06272781_5461 [Streptomyces sp. 1222.2]|nr:hypothetical protein SAMN06272781_5461 [Streptomyces sp. 1222.2]
MPKGVSDEFVGSQDAEVVEVRRKAPTREDTGGEGTCTWRRFEATEQFQCSTSEKFAVGARADRMLEDEDSDIIVMLRCDTHDPKQPIADSLRRATHCGQSLLERVNAVRAVHSTTLDEAVGVDDGRGAGAEQD